MPCHRIFEILKTMFIPLHVRVRVNKLDILLLKIIRNSLNDRIKPLSYTLGCGINYINQHFYLRKRRNTAKGSVLLLLL